MGALSGRGSGVLNGCALHRKWEIGGGRIDRARESGFQTAGDEAAITRTRNAQHCKCNLAPIDPICAEAGKMNTPGKVEEDKVDDTQEKGAKSPAQPTRVGADQRNISHIPHQAWRPIFTRADAAAAG